MKRAGRPTSPRNASVIIDRDGNVALPSSVTDREFKVESARVSRPGTSPVASSIKPTVPQDTILGTSGILAGRTNVSPPRNIRAPPERKELPRPMSPRNATPKVAVASDDDEINKLLEEFTQDEPVTKTSPPPMIPSSSIDLNSIPQLDPEMTKLPSKPAPTPTNVDYSSFLPSVRRQHQYGETNPKENEDYIDLRHQARASRSSEVVDETPVQTPEPIKNETLEPPTSNIDMLTDEPEKPKEEPVPEGHMRIDTDYGSFIVPKYDDMSDDEKQRHYNTFDIRIKILNETWAKQGISVEPPRPGESLTNLHVRYKQAVKYIMIRSGVTMWKYILIACWGGFEYLACKAGLKASGYLKSQMKIYDIYHSQLIEMGEMTGFSEGWPAWIKILVLSCVNAVIFIAVNSLINDAKGADTEVMKLMSSFILGNTPTVSTDNEHGVPQPNDVSSAFKGVEVGGFDLGSLGNLDIGSMIGGVLGGFTNNIQGGGGATSSNTSRTRRRARGSGPSFTK